MATDVIRLRYGRYLHGVRRGSLHVDEGTLEQGHQEVQGTAAASRQGWLAHDRLPPST